MTLPVKAVVAVISMAFASLEPASAFAGGLIAEVKLGVLAHDVPDLWSGFSLESQSADINIEALLTPSVAVVGGTLRPAVGASINTEGDTSHAYVDARWQYDTSCGLFFSLGLGAAIHDGETAPVKPDAKALGSRVLFHIPFEVGYYLDAHNSLSAYFEHTSNAGLADSNEGLDRIGARYGYRF